MKKKFNTSLGATPGEKIPKKLTPADVAKKELIELYMKPWKDEYDSIIEIENRTQDQNDRKNSVKRELIVFETLLMDIEEYTGSTPEKTLKRLAANDGIPDSDILRKDIAALYVELKNVKE